MNDKKYVMFFVLFIGFFSFFNGHAEDKKMLEAKKQALVFDESTIKNVSEAFGHIIGRNLENPGFTFDLESIIKGIRDGALGKDSPMTEEEYERSIAMIQENVFNELAEINLKKANEFLQENVFDKEIVELEKGKLQYKIIDNGEGMEVREHDAPLIHYTGKYLDGSIFGSSIDSGDPVALPLDQTIVGFSKGLLGAKEGEKRRLFVHPDFGYGTSGHLPPNSLLIFDVEIIKTNNLSVEDSERVGKDLGENSDDAASLFSEDAEEPEEAEVLQ